METPALPARRRPAGRGWLLLGLGLAALGVAAYAGQLLARRLAMPWYLPITGTAATGCVLVALVQARGLGRWIALVVVLLLAVVEWRMVWSVPAYTGPVAAGQSFPAFATVRADGTPFTQRDLDGGPNHVLVFFRGRW